MQHKQGELKRERRQHTENIIRQRKTTIKIDNDKGMTKMGRKT